MTTQSLHVFCIISLKLLRSVDVSDLCSSFCALSCVYCEVFRSFTYYYVVNTDVSVQKHHFTAVSGQSEATLHSVSLVVLNLWVGPLQRVTRLILGGCKTIYKVGKMRNSAFITKLF